MRFDNVVAFLEKLTGEIGIPGVDCTIHVGYDQVFRYCCGYQDLENCIPMQPHSLYYIYSATKVITCAAGSSAFRTRKMTSFLKMWENTCRHLKICLINRWIKTGIEVVKKCEKPLRILHLLNMTGGFSYNRKRPGYIGASAEYQSSGKHEAGC